MSRAGAAAVAGKVCGVGDGVVWCDARQKGMMEHVPLWSAMVVLTKRGSLGSRVLGPVSSLQ